MAKAYLLAASLILCLAASIGAQAPAQSNAHYTLRGSVLNSLTGEPVPKALVTINGAPSKTITSGPDGQFEAEDLAAGTYYVTATRPGYADSRMTGGQFTPVQVGQDTGSLTLKLVPLGRITGRVVDTDGEPVPNINVQALQRTVRMGHATWRPNAGAQTDDSGNFVLDMLQPGQYLVTSGGQEVYPGMGGGNEQASRLMYRRLYFPNSPDIASAQVLDLSGGESAQADLTLSEVLGAEIHFAVVPPQPWVHTTLLDDSGEQLNVGVRRDRRTGGWLLPSVPPGNWELEVVSNANGQQLSGEASLEVGKTDVRNVVVQLVATMQVPVLFTGAPVAENMAMPVNLVLVSPSAHEPNAYWAGPVTDREGTHYAISGLPPGNYRAQVSGVQSHCVDSVTSGASDLARVDYVVPENGTPQPISIALGTDCGTIDLSRKTGGSFAAIIVGGVNAREPLMMAGSSIRATLAPGDYEVYALPIPVVNNIEYANPDVLRNYVSRHVTVSGGQNGSYKLDLNSTEAK